MTSTPPAYSMSSALDVHQMEHMGPPRWSALAITAFVLSIIGFLGFTAILGIILGIAGIVVTRGGKRRGMGLAIAAIPISVVTGLIGALFVIGSVQFLRMIETTKHVERSMSGSADTSAVAAAIFERSSESFQKEVSQEQLVSWLEQMNRKHGKLVSVDRTFSAQTLTPEGEHAWYNLPAKFVNGPGMLRLNFDQTSLLQPRLDDIDIDGVSPRPSSKEKSEAN